MGWVTRPNGRRYLYRSRRVGGRVVTEYLAADGTDSGHRMAQAWEEECRQRAEAKAAARATDTHRQKRLAQLEQLAAGNDLRAVAHGLLAVLGFHRPKRGEWRMRRGYNPLAALFAPKRRPRIDYKAPKSDAEAVALFAAARDGDADAVAKLPELIRDREWVDWIGDLSRQAAAQLVDRVARGDPVMRAGVNAKLAELNRQLAGAAPTVLETLFVRRVMNGWLLTHVVELELALTDDLRTQDQLDKLLARSQRRFVEAVRELARVRRLQAPAVMARLQAELAAPGPAAG